MKFLPKIAQKIDSAFGSFSKDFAQIFCLFSWDNNRTFDNRNMFFVLLRIVHIFGFFWGEGGGETGCFIFAKNKNESWAKTVKKTYNFSSILEFYAKNKFVHLQAALLPWGGLGLGHHPHRPHGPGAHHRHAVQVGEHKVHILRYYYI